MGPMPFELLTFQNLLPAFALVVARVSGVVLGVPMLSSVQIPREAKVWLTATLSLMVFPLAAPHLPMGLTLGQSVVGMVGEFIIGEVIGLGTGLVFVAAEVAGKLVSHQAGLSIGTTINPFFDEESMVLDQLWFFTAAMLFLALRGHVLVVTALLDSIVTIPPMMARIDGSAGEFAMAMLQSTFQLGLRLAGPAIVALMLTSLVMGFLTRTMPQINVLSVGFAIKILVALFMVAMTISASEDVLSHAMQLGFDQIAALFEHMSEAMKRGG